MDMKALMGNRGRQRGAALILFVVGMVVIVGMAGLALDLGHAYLNKTRLQNVLDASALSGAKVLDETHDTDQATAAAQTTFTMQLSGELKDAGLVPVIQFSDTLVPFDPNYTNPRYVRVKVVTFPMTVWFAQVLPGIGTTQTIGGSAVAGPSPPLGTAPGSEVCDIAPMVACADPTDTDCSDGSCYGYQMNAETETVLKTGSHDDWDVGPGNFQLITLDCGTGGACVRQNMAGGYGGCVEPSGNVTTEPGNTVGPVAQGLNTRFGIYNGPVSPDQYPPDVITTYGLDFWWSDYETRLNQGASAYNHPEGVPERRVIAMPLGNCTGTTNGRGTVEVLGLGCFFLTQPAEQNGFQRVYGQFIGDCKAEGQIAEDPEPNPGGAVLYKIQLYKDPDSGDS